jgi:hypothetical protein
MVMSFVLLLSLVFKARLSWTFVLVEKWEKIDWCLESTVTVVLCLLLCSPCNVFQVTFTHPTPAPFAWGIRETSLSQKKLLWLSVSYLNSCLQGTLALAHRQSLLFWMWQTVQERRFFRADGTDTLYSLLPSGLHAKCWSSNWTSQMS